MAISSPRSRLEHTERYAHGTRSRYVAGECRCALCRRANTTYFYARYRSGQPDRSNLPIPENVAALVGVREVQHDCGKSHFLSLGKPRTVFKPNGALRAYLGWFECGGHVVHVYKRIG